MANPSVRSSSHGNGVGTGTAYPVVLPATISAGDTLLILIAVDAALPLTVPSGWTYGGGGANIGLYFYGFFKKAVGDEDDTTVNVTHSGSNVEDQPFAYVCCAIQDAADPTVYAPIAGSYVTDTSTGPNPPNLAGAYGSQEHLFIGVAAWRDGSTSVSAYPTSYADSQVTDRYNDSAGCGIAVACRQLDAASDNPAAFTISASEVWIAQTFLVYPTVIIKTVTLTGAVSPLTIVAPGVQPVVTLPVLSPVSIYAPTVEESVALSVLAPLSILAPETQPTAQPAALNPVSLLAPEVQPSVSLPVLTPVSILSPEVAQTSEAALLCPLSILAPTVEQDIPQAVLAPLTVLAPTVETELIITLTVLAPVMVAAPETQPDQTASPGILSPLTVLAPSVDQNVDLPTLAPLSILDLEVQPAAEPAAISPVTVLAPTVEQNVSLPTLSPLSIPEPKARPDTPIPLTALSPVTVLAPTVEHTLGLATVSPISIYEPTVEQLVALATLQPLTLLAPDIQDIQSVGLSVLAPVRIIPPTYVRRQIRTEEGSFTASSQDGALAAGRQEASLTASHSSGTLTVTRHEGSLTADHEEGHAQ